MSRAEVLEALHHLAGSLRRAAPNDRDFYLRLIDRRLDMLNRLNRRDTDSATHNDAFRAEVLLEGRDDELDAA